MKTPTKRPATPTPANASNTEKDPHDWVTGDEPMTGAQKSYLKTLSDEGGVEADATLTKGEASQRIHELKDQKHVVDHRADGTADNARKNPADWVSGDEPMTGAQASYLKTLAGEADVPFDNNLTKAAASEKIDELQKNNPRTVS